MTHSPLGPVAYAYEFPNPYHPEGGGSGVLVLDEPLRVGERVRRAFEDVAQDPVSHEWTVVPGPEREWEVVAIEPTDRDGEVAGIRGYRGEKPPIMQGRLILRPLG